ncbi:uncharacterized protein LOC111396311 isoform X3 [Olea europaea var. sylvestris]|uniref:uncharacterized protein LOC111396311 isoform X3 n=1 Tax=Olea europaea var. sylvestris TaxID=158386 RepID=UPI000C1D4921|nr:uncharacterized protein LOC111396311 isoform X3 [Olea europaea var. sylvestris]
MVITQSNINPAIHFASFTICRRGHHRLRNCFSLPRVAAFGRSLTLTTATARTRAFSTNDTQDEKIDDVEKLPNKPPICTADEIHYVSVNNSGWRLALWRYNPSPQAPPRNHPLLLLSGVGTNAIGYDLSPGSSFARYMCGQGFDTWILEVRGAGLSMHGSDAKDVEKSAHAMSEFMEAAVENVTNGLPSREQQSTNTQNDLEKAEIAVANNEPTRIATAWDESKLVTKLTETFMRLSERLSGFLSESQFNIMSAKFFDQISRLLEDSFIFERFSEVRGKLLSLLETRQNSAAAGQIRDLSQKLVDIIEEGQRSVSPQLFDLQERLITTIEDFQKQLDLIIKYDWDFDHYLEEDVPAAMEYIRAQSKPKDGRLLAIGHSMGGILLYAMLSRYGTVPAKLLLQLTTAFRAGGLRDRSCQFFYKDHLHKSNVPVLALAGDRDLICPPEAVYETVKLIPEHLVTYKVFGERDGPHYAHYDLVGGRMAAEQLYPCVVQHLSHYDSKLSDHELSCSNC